MDLPTVGHAPRNNVTTVGYSPKGDHLLYWQVEPVANTIVTAFIRLWLWSACYAN